MGRGTLQTIEWLLNHKGVKDYQPTYTTTTLTCPRCGIRGLVVEDGPGDYYMGPDYICLDCGCRCNLDSMRGDTDPALLERLRYLRRMTNEQS